MTHCTEAVFAAAAVAGSVVGAAAVVERTEELAVAVAGTLADSDDTVFAVTETVVVAPVAAEPVPGAEPVLVVTAVEDAALAPPRHQARRRANGR